jgi:outer membrane protein TolC
VQRPVDIPGFAQGNFQLGLTVNQLLYDGGRWWTQLARTGALEEAARGQLMEQQAASELEATRRFYELLRAQLVLAVLESAVQRSGELLERAKGLFDAGRAQRRDVLDAEVNLGNDRIAVIRQRQAIAAAQASLLQWVGQRPREVVATPPPGFEAGAPQVEGVVGNGRDVPLDPEVLVGLARRRRPLLQVLDAQAKGARLSVEIARADYLPRLSANAGYSRSAPSAGLFVDPGRQHALSVGASLSWDLFSGLATQAQVERAEAQRSELDRQREQALVELESEVVRATQALAAQLEIHRLSQRNLELAEQSFSAESQRYAAGASTSLSVRDAQVRALSASLTRLQTRVDVEVARAALERLVGGRIDSLETP